MRWFLYAISLVWIVAGCCMILYTSETRNLFKNMLRTVDRKMLCFFPFTAGLLLLFSAPASHYSWFIRLLGILAVIKGGFIFFNPQGLWRKLVDGYLNAMSEQACRLTGILIIILGTALFSWIL